MTTKSFPALLESLIAQRKNCRGDACRAESCRRCRRGEDWARRQHKASDTPGRRAVR